ncbi:MAG: hypothetical protein P4L22_01680 [Candidatus Babeliales bacterium]|nr:hypothetical protein [Candidatus Babeliales bacterium]
MIKNKTILIIIVSLICSALRASEAVSNFKIINMTNDKAQVDFTCTDESNAQHSGKYIVQAHDIADKNTFKFPISYAGLVMRKRVAQVARGAFTCNHPKSISKIIMKKYVNKEEEITKLAMSPIQDSSPEISTVKLPHSINLHGTYAIIQTHDNSFVLEELDNKPIAAKAVVKKQVAQPKKLATPKPIIVGGMPAVRFANDACDSDANCVTDGGYSCDLTKPNNGHLGTCNRPWERT